MKTAVVVAAGESIRLELNKNKALFTLNGMPVFIFSLKKFAALQFDKIILVTKPAESKNFERFIKQYNIKCDIVEGGLRRQDSVFNALKYLAPFSPQTVVVHDAARPFFNENILNNILNSGLPHSFSGAIFAMPVKDTIKEYKGSFVVETLNRKKIISVQTPQIFNFPELFEAYKKYGNSDFTDDSSIMERDGYKIFILKSDETNFKITTKFDLFLASKLLESNEGFTV